MQIGRRRLHVQTIESKPLGGICLGAVPIAALESLAGATSDLGEFSVPKLVLAEDSRCRRFRSNVAVHRRVANLDPSRNHHLRWHLVCPSFRHPHTRSFGPQRTASRSPCATASWRSRAIRSFHSSRATAPALTFGARRSRSSMEL